MLKLKAHRSHDVEARELKIVSASFSIWTCSKGCFI